MNFFHTSVLAAVFSQFCTCFDACLDANVVPSRDRLCVPLQNLPSGGGPRPHSGPGSKGVVQDQNGSIRLMVQKHRRLKPVEVGS